jgi:outer membrane protein assembly factor BamB
MRLVPFARTRPGLTSMKKLLIVGLLLAAAGALPAQDPIRRLYTTPCVPPQEALDRLRLTAAWTATVPTEGRRDGLYSVQVLPRRGGEDLLVQTRGGAIMMFDGETGRMRWLTRVGTPFRVSQPLAYNNGFVFVINNIQLYALDRATGRARWDFEMPSGASAPPVADEEQIYLAMTNGRFEAYTLPNLALWAQLARQGKVPGALSPLEAARVRRGFDLPAIGPLSGAREAYRLPPLGPQPTLLYSFIPEDRIETAPLLSGDRLLLAGVGGQVVGLAKGAAKVAWPPFQARGRILLPPGQFEDTGYVASSDGNLYAVGITNGKLLWRFTTGGRPSQPVSVLDESVYMSVDRSGLYRVHRNEGDEVWFNEDAARFLASNMKFVYAADAQGRLLVIDRARGTTLSTYDCTRDFVFPVRNQWTDRLYLAANDGSIICLHDRDTDTPEVLKTPPKERKPPEGNKPGPKELPPPGPGDGGKPKPPPAGGGVKP